MLKWKYKTEGDIHSSPAIGSDGTIYVGSEDSYVYALNSDGTLKWKYQIKSSVRSSPAIGSDGTIYIGSWNGYVYALNSDGTLKWKYKIGDYSWPSPPNVYSSPAIGSDGTIYIGSWNGYVYALNSDGTLKWKYKIGDYVWSSPAIGSDGTIYIGSYDNYLYALGGSGGEGASVPSAPQNLVAIAGDGSVQLTWDAPEDGGSAITSYKIYRGTGSGSENYLIEISSSTTTYTDDYVTNGQVYYYYVTAVNSVGEGGRSNEVSATPQVEATVPSAPQNLVAIAGDGSVQLTWDAPADNSTVTQYKIYRNGTVIATVPTSQLWYRDTDVKNGVTYTYYVVAVNSAGEGSPSYIVNTMPSSEGDGGFSLNLFLWAILGVIIAAVIVIAILAIRRKKP